ncbi:hypothetical protein IM538_22310 [Cytobacillus suaedae]|nr:hypothetical protein IM538_22310 [Cytobacillus suaedae]
MDRKENIHDHEIKYNITEEKLRQIMLRAYIKGENLKHINANDLIEDIAKNLKGKSGA